MESEFCGLFPESEFENVTDQLKVPNVDGWELFVESHGFKIYRLLNEYSELYSYQMYGELPDVDPELCYQVYMDLEYRKQWDSYVKVLEVKNCEGRNLIYWEVSFPFPLWNRDYVYARESKVVQKNDQTVWVILAKSVDSPSVPEKGGVVRVDDYSQSAVLCSNGKGGTTVFMKYYDNPKGNIPKWLINWAAKTGVSQFLTTMEAACKKYPQNLESSKQKGAASGETPDLKS